MPAYLLHGVTVEFPYDAYPCQLTYMASVIRALETGQHALLESPTGTGKTLCLLCAVLAWREHFKNSVKQRAADLGSLQKQNTNDQPHAWEDAALTKAMKGQVQFIRSSSKSS